MAVNEASRRFCSDANTTPGGCLRQPDRHGMDNDFLRGESIVKTVFLTALVAASIILQGCGPNNISFDTAPYIAQDYAPYREDGTGAIEGRAMVRTGSGDLLTCAGHTIFAYPMTGFTSGVTLAMWVGQPMKKEKVDLLAKTGGRRATCDQDGRFKITGLKAGGWIAVTVIPWRKGDQSGELLLRQDYIRVADGQATSTVITNAAYIREGYCCRPQ
jgi:hypothetical protein